MEHLATAAPCDHTLHCRTAQKISVTFSKAPLLDHKVVRSGLKACADVGRNPAGFSQAPKCLFPTGFSLGPSL